MKNISFSKSSLPLIGSYDVVVLGGGPAGVCAAIEAARSGAKVLLAEATGGLGGMATSALVGPFMTSYDRDGERPVVGGLFTEIVERLSERGGAIVPSDTDSPSVYTSFIKKYHRHVTPIDSFELEVLLDEMTREAGVEVMLYTRFADAITEGEEIKVAVLLALEGLVGVEAKVFIDCTGNADVANAAGVPTYKGHEESGIPQPATLMFEVSGADDERYENYAARPEYPVKVYRTPEAGTYKVNHYHVFGADATSSESMTRAHMQARTQVKDAFSVLKNKTPGFENAIIKKVAPSLGVRESRHIVGKYKITVGDVSRGTKFDDRISAYGFGMDVHNRTEKESGNFKTEVAPVYYVPYRSLLPLGCDNLLVAGKTVSCESQAAGGLRCMPSAMAMGQAAGLAAALAVKGGTRVEKIDITELQNELRSRGAILD
ncbi:MAG: FAD-dependent oxidoreductase [Clostridia bacterium]|nr:FAD-dependent oxidoreductase [Clostridia bacterium]